MSAPLVFSIRPEYVERILDGSKRWEFRTRVPSIDPGELALIYESRGRKKIVGAFVVSSVSEGTPEEIWALAESTGGGQGIDRVPYDEYFAGRDSAVALRIQYSFCLSLDLPPSMRPPMAWSRWPGPWPMHPDRCIDGFLLLALLEGRGGTIADLARRCFVGRDHMSRILHGHIEPGASLVSRIADATGLTADQVLGRCQSGARPALIRGRS